MSLYRAMDRRALDAAYNNSAAVADSAAYIADWLTRSAAVRARLPQHLDLAFGETAAARLDFFSCGRRGAPTLLFFHGGYWQRNAKEGFAFVAEGLLAHGFHVAVAGYTLAPEARMDAIVGEARRALHWLHGTLAALGGNPARIYLSGWSAGGQLAPTLMGEPAARAQPRRPWRGRRRLPLMWGVPLLLLGAGLYFYLTSGRYQSTDDAYVRAAQEAISADVSGRVSEVDVHDNQAVRRGQVLFCLDDRRFRLPVQAA